MVTHLKYMCVMYCQFDNFRFFKRFMDRWWKEPNILLIDYFLSSNLVEISKLSNLKRALCQEKYHHKHELGEQKTVRLKLARLPEGFRAGKPGDQSEDEEGCGSGEKAEGKGRF